MVCVPDLMAAYQAGMLDLEGVTGGPAGDDRPLRVDGRPRRDPRRAAGLNAQQIKEWRVEKAGYDSKYATLYWPWIKVFDPADRRRTSSCRRAATWPASGPATTTRAACTRRRPTRSSAARSRSRLKITKAEHDLLNPNGINCIRAFPGRGIRVWGARTLSSDPAWRYLNVRRLFNYIEESILEGTHWVVFEPNDMDLWAAGPPHDHRVPAAESGATARCSVPRRSEAFYVKCDAETNPPESVDAGQARRARSASRR